MSRTRFNLCDRRDVPSNDDRVDNHMKGAPRLLTSTGIDNSDVVAVLSLFLSNGLYFQLTTYELGFIRLRMRRQIGLVLPFVITSGSIQLLI